MKNLVLILTIIGSISFASCGDGNSDSHAGHDHSEDHAGMSDDDVTVVKPEYMTNDSVLQEHIDEYVHYYTHLQGSLADDDAKGASSWAVQTNDFIESLDRTKLSNIDLKTYDRYMNIIKPQVIAFAGAADIEKQRLAFELISNATYELAKTFGTTEPIYQAHCPMAFDGKGALWLTESNEIANPYYGSDMYSCGSVREVIKK